MPAGERVKLIVPILMKDGLNVRPEDLRVIVQFFDKVNGKKVEKTHAPEPSSRCVTEPADWADGEEIMEVTYYMPPPDGGGDDRLRKPQVLWLHRQIVLQG